MSFKSLLVPIQPTPACGQALPRIVEFARVLGADLTGVCARAPVMIADPWIADAEIMQQLTEDDEAQVKTAEKDFRSASGRLNGQAHWRSVHDFPNTALKIQAASADLIVTTLEKGPEATTVTPGSLVLEAGVPVLVLPSPAPPIRTDHILVAWRNSADARRAVTVALPLLERAKRVTAVQVVRSEDADDAWVGLQAVKDRLARNGVAVDAELVFKDDEDDAEALMAAALERQVDMIVLGGYGHSRAREWILGGVTHDLLASTSIPLFMVH